MKINHRHITLFIISIVTIAVTVFGYIFIYKQTIRQADHYVTSNSELVAENKRKQNEQELIKVYNSTKDTRLTLTKLFVREDKIVDFIEMIEKVSTDSGSNTELVSITNSDGKVKAKINSKGTWSHVMKSLVLIENLPISMSLSNVTLNTVSSVENAEDKKGIKKAQNWELSLDVEAVTIK